MHPDHRTDELRVELADVELQIQNIGLYLGGEVGDTEFMKLLGKLVVLRERRAALRAELAPE